MFGKKGRQISYLNARVGFLLRELEAERGRGQDISRLLENTRTSLANRTRDVSLNVERRLMVEKDLVHVLSVVESAVRKVLTPRFLRSLPNRDDRRVYPLQWRAGTVRKLARILGIVVPPPGLKFKD